MLDSANQKLYNEVLGGQTLLLKCNDDVPDVTDRRKEIVEHPGKSANFCHRSQNQ